MRAGRATSSFYVLFEGYFVTHRNAGGDIPISCKNKSAQRRVFFLVFSVPISAT